MSFLYLLVPSFSHLVLSVGNFTILSAPHTQCKGPEYEKAIQNFMEKTLKMLLRYKL